MTALDVESDGEAASRDDFIPVRKTELIDALVDHGQLASEEQRREFRRLCRVLAAIYHYEYFERLEKLRDCYFYFSPELDPHARFDHAALERAYADLVGTLTAVLRDANFVEMSHAEVERARRAQTFMRVEVKSTLDDFRDVRVFWRGRHQEEHEVAEWFGLRKRRVKAEIHDDVVLLVATKPPAEIASKRERKLLAERKIRPGSVLIKYFRNIASSDLNALFPNVRVVMSNVDKLVFGVPAIAGGVPILLNLASTATVLFLVVGFYLGVSGAVEDSDLKTALAGLSALLALGGYLLQQWMRYQRQTLKYQKRLADNVYFRNVTNNAGIFDAIVAAAEDQECKEASLAYYFLSTAAAAPTPAELERQVGAWLKATFGVDARFKVDEALARLDRLGLLKRAGERLSVTPLGQALVRLDAVWQGFLADRPAGG
jgi:hypothetical protein